MKLHSKLPSERLKRYIPSTAIIIVNNKNSAFKPYLGKSDKPGVHRVVHPPLTLVSATAFACVSLDKVLTNIYSDAQGDDTAEKNIVQEDGCIYRKYEKVNRVSTSEAAVDDEDSDYNDNSEEDNGNYYAGSGEDNCNTSVAEAVDVEEDRRDNNNS
ncbi:Hypothetical predicted protein [Octopus vulgaris]|uniref:Uncharacterized protein n=1 Tax=Octopus vulgaris TaxID=6645 RepID=A0AA36FGH2_OCTVU|nr:Hypothetical predicted protein [Octopus vulgaris]